jgi:hypothetical protein
MMDVNKDDGLFTHGFAASEDSLNAGTKPIEDVVAEVIFSTTSSFVAEVHRGKEAPAFGSWVRVGHTRGIELYGLVSHVEVESLDPNRRAVALGKTNEELRREMPHVLELLRVTFRAQTVAYRDQGGSVRQTLPPFPASIHDFVYVCSPQKVCALGRPYDYLRTLARNPDPAVPADDLIISALRQIYESHGRKAEGEAELVEAGRVLSRLLNDDHERLHSILRRAV